MPDNDNNLLVAEVRALMAEVRAHSASIDAYRAENQAGRAELVAVNARLGRTIDSLEADVAAIMRHLFGEDSE